MNLSDLFFQYREKLGAVMANDYQHVMEKDRNYNGSWKRRGGANAFFMLARKWDRLEAMLGDGGLAGHHDIFRAIAEDRRAEGLLHDIRDLRTYLALVEAEMVARGVVYLPEYRVTIENLTEKQAMAHALKAPTAAAPEAGRPMDAPAHDAQPELERPNGLDTSVR